MTLFEELTQSEKKVLQHMADGLQSKTIAKMLFVSPHTVKNHKTNICHKLGLGCIHELYLFALKNAVLLKSEGGGGYFLSFT